MPTTRPGREATTTFAEAAQLDPDEHAGELEAGRWRPVTKDTWRHGEIVGNVYAALRNHLRAHPGWSLSVGDPGVKLSRDPDTLRGPDVAVIRADRRPTGRGVDGWLEGAPDLAIEVLGDAQPVSSLMKKALEYLAAGAKLVWLLDPDAGSVMVVRPGDRVAVVGPDDRLDGGDVLPGFACRVGDLFE